MACPACGSTNREGAVFCDRCGTRLGAPTGLAGPSLADRVAAPAAERRSVTVLFADAQGSTALTERIGDEEAYRLIQACVARMTEAVERHEGTVPQFRGDGIMALFGAPVAHEDAAVRAVTAALEMQQALEEHRRAVEERLGAAASFRIGIHTGPVVVGRVGDATLVDYTAIGETANLAARLEQAAGPGEVLVSDTTRWAVRDYVECVEVAPLTVKGLSQPVTAWRAVERRRVATRLDAGVARGLSRLVGRQRDLAVLVGLAQDVRTGRGRVALVSGEAGVGKSRLLWELRSALPEGTGWLEGRCVARARRTPWQPVAEVLRSGLGVDATSPPDEIRRRIDDEARRWPADVRAEVPHLRWVLGVETAEPVALEPRQRRAGVVGAFVSVLRASARRRPLVVVVEDVDWADEGSEAAMAALSAAIADVPVLLMLTFRSGHEPPVAPGAGVTHVTLRQLAGVDIAELARAVLGAPLGDAALSLVAERTGGNPLFVEQLATSMVESGVLVPDGDDLELTVPPDRIDLPTTLQDVVLARIDRLARPTREVLQVASVLGREFPLELLDRLATTGSNEVHLARLEEVELLQRREPGGSTCAFTHAVVHDVTYGTLLSERRCDLHRRAAGAIEELFAGRLDRHAAALAHHWLEAGEELRALDHLERAGDQALAGLSVLEAEEAYGRAIEIAAAHGQTGRVVGLTGRQVEAALLRGAMGPAREAAERMRQVAAAAGDANAEALALDRLSYVDLMRHDFEAAEATARRALDVGLAAAEAGGAADGAVTAGTGLMLVCHVLGRRGDVASVAGAIAPLVERARPDAAVSWRWLGVLDDNWRARWAGPEPPIGPDDLAGNVSLFNRLWALWVSALSAAGAGGYLEAIRQLDHVISIAERTGELQARVRALNTMGWIHHDLGDPEGAMRWNRACLEQLAPLEFPTSRKIEANARLNLADDHALVGDLEQAEAELERVGSVVRAPAVEDTWMLWRYTQHYLCGLGEVRLAEGRAEEALAAAGECLPLAERTESRKYLVRARRLRGRALHRLGRATEAADDLHEAVTLARAIGNPPQLWRSLAALAELGGAGAAQHRAEALAVIDAVAAGLGDHPLRGTLLRSPEREALVTAASGSRST